MTFYPLYTRGAHAHATARRLTQRVKDGSKELQEQLWRGRETRCKYMCKYI